ncbi:hypothetical protein SLS60_006491 [Paraconiothyrium brasiliense]|uniref:MFS transporter n=1 Tax=Paraconiothyrium brasiliense TaxID=300254 RepID=A0ABR3RAW7_9PLEO
MEEKPAQSSQAQGNMMRLRDAGREESDGSEQLDMQPQKEGRSKSWFDASYHRPSRVPRPDGKRELHEKDCWDKLAYSWPTWKKCMYLASIAGIQISMNFNTSVFPSAVNPISEHFGISTQAARGGLSTAGGSVTLGLIADLYEPEEQHWPLCFIVLSSTIGTSIGGVIGGPIERFLTWRWNFWIQLIFGVVVQAVHFFMPESRSTILIDREAKRRRKTGEDPNIYGPNELKSPRISLKEAGKIWLRPFEMFVREPIVLFLSLLSGFSDALIFTFLEAFAITFPDNFGFGTLAVAWAFIPINASYFFTYFLYWPVFWRDEHLKKKNGPDSLSPERRLKPLLLLALFEPIGLFGFAWTCMGPPQTHWIAPMIFSFLVGLANFAIYYSSVDYMIAAYGPYSASATGGNAFARDFLAGIAAMYATPLYTNLSDKRPSEYATTVLACLSCLIVVPIYIFYWKGPQIRKASKFASILAEDRKAEGVRRLSKADNLPV